MGLPLVPNNSNSFVIENCNKSLCNAQVEACGLSLVDKNFINFASNAELFLSDTTKDPNCKTWPMTILGSAFPRKRLFIYAPTTQISESALLVRGGKGVARQGSGAEGVLLLLLKHACNSLSTSNREDKLQNVRTETDDEKRGVPVSLISFRGPELVRKLACWLMNGLLWSLPSSLKRDLSGSPCLGVSTARRSQELELQDIPPISVTKTKDEYGNIHTN